MNRIARDNLLEDDNDGKQKGTESSQYANVRGYFQWYESLAIKLFIHDLPDRTHNFYEKAQLSAPPIAAKQSILNLRLTLV